MAAWVYNRGRVRVRGYGVKVLACVVIIVLDPIQQEIFSDVDQRKKIYNRWVIFFPQARVLYIERRGKRTPSSGTRCRGSSFPVVHSRVGGDPVAGELSARSSGGATGKETLRNAIGSSFKGGRYRTLISAAHLKVLES